MQRTTKYPILVIILIVVCICKASWGQERETIDIDLPMKEFRAGHLELGGKNNDGRAIEFDLQGIEMQPEYCVSLRF